MDARILPLEHFRSRYMEKARLARATQYMPMGLDTSAAAMRLMWSLAVSSANIGYSLTQCALSAFAAALRDSSSKGR